MKKICLMVMISLASLGLAAQDMTLVGTWHIVDYKIAVDEEVHLNEDELRKDNQVWDLVMNQDGSLIQTSNMHEAGEIESWTGNWRTEQDNLILSLLIGDNMYDLVYAMEFLGDDLKITRGNPSGTFKVESVFRKE